MTDLRQAYREALISLMTERPEVVCLDSDTGLFQADDFGAAADRYINVGICEQNLIGVAAGLAASGRATTESRQSPNILVNF